MKYALWRIITNELIMAAHPWAAILFCQIVWIIGKLGLSINQAGIYQRE